MGLDADRTSAPIQIVCPSRLSAVCVALGLGVCLFSGPCLVPGVEEKVRVCGHPEGASPLPSARLVLMGWSAGPV